MPQLSLTSLGGIALAVIVYLALRYRSKLSSGVATASGSHRTPTLDSFAVDFTRLAKEGKLDPVVGREDEVIRLAQILSRRTKNNAVLVGPPGVGKTAIVEGLAQRIVKGEVPETLKNKRLLALEVASLLSGTKYRGEFEERAKRIVCEITAANRSIILFIDEVQSVIQSQGTEGAVNFSDILKPALSRGELQMVGATTMPEYEKYIKTDPSLERRFQPIPVDEPNEEESLIILQGVKDKYREYHGVEFTDAALSTAVQLTNEKIKDRKLPDKAIDAMDEAAAMVRVSHLDAKIHAVLYTAAVQKDPTLEPVWKKIQEIDRKFITNLPDTERRPLHTEREQLEKALQEKGVLVVDAEDVQKVVDEWIGKGKRSKKAV